MCCRYRSYPGGMTRALLIIDIQNDYFEGGAYPLPGAENAAAIASDLLSAVRNSGLPVVHVQHIWDAPDAEFMIPGTWGSEINAAVAPLASEPVIVKAYPNAFRETELLELLSTLEANELVVCGMMSNLCVDATVRAAVDLGFDVTVAHDACAAADLAFDGVEVPAESVHAAFMAGLTDYGDVLASADIAAHLGSGDATA